MPRVKSSTVTSPPATPKPPLPNGWKWVRFGEVVNNLNETVKTPLAAGLERFVGLEHLEPQDLRIRTWGNVADGTTFNRVFRAGQVLFGKRRAYQRKAALADFDGVCSGDIYVLAANEPHLVPGLLPFLVQTEAFGQHAEDTSEGSLSPRTKWKYLAEYEFALPSDPAEQRRIAELLRAADEAVEAWRVSNTTADGVRRTMLESLLDDLSARGSTVELMKIRDAGDVQLGRQRSPQYNTGRHKRPYLRVANVFDGYLDLSDVLEMDFDEADFARFQLHNGDILLNEWQSRELVGRSCIYRNEIPNCCFQNTLVRFRASNVLTAEYAQAYFQLMYYRGDFAKIASQTTSIAHLGAERFGNLSIRVPSLEAQQELMREVHAIEKIQTTASERAEATYSIYRQLLTHLLTPP